jgi:hypothetical protein
MMVKKLPDGTDPLNSDTDGDGVTDGQEKQMQQIPTITVHSSC